MVAPRFNLMLKGGSSFVFQQKITTADVSIDTDWLRETQLQQHSTIDKVFDAKFKSKD